ncbi:MAG: Serine/threonine protein kinase PrkC, regulator of stationary phase [Myxococcales bacterium]|nr:Serine/threonine protein kinase PrkC, regulator of stationary phase [Myxococcales bacterium]
MFLGKYRVESILGQGGMGVVAECTHLQLNERVALKMLRQDVLLDPDAVERFMREAQAAAKLKSEYVARVRDVGTLESGTPFMVMEYLDGQDLGVLITERGTLPSPWATELILQTCEALSEAHSLGIVHRDVKPTNLFVTWRPDGTALIKVLDFGISKSSMGTDMRLTQTQSLLGTPAYMSPEQMRSARLVDGRTDIWSLGTVLYELLEGRKPFEAESFSEMCVKVAVDPPAEMSKAPPELQHVVLRCLAKSPEQRYSSMAELARDLVPFTQDPHQSSMLVERMQRMLARGEGNWEGGVTGVGQRGVPHQARDLGSAPVRSQSQSPWSGGTDPAGARWHGGSDPSGAMFRTPVPGSLQHSAVPQRHSGREASAPAIAPSAVLPVPNRRRWAFVLLGIALVGITATAVAVTVGTGGTRTPAATKPAVVETPPVVETRPPVVEAKPPVVETKPPVVETKPTVAETPVTTTKTTKTKTTKTIKKPVTQVKKPDPKVTKDPKETKPVVKPECNAFDHPHGCPRG